MALLMFYIGQYIVVCIECQILWIKSKVYFSLLLLFSRDYWSQGVVAFVRENHFAKCLFANCFAYARERLKARAVYYKTHAWTYVNKVLYGLSLSVSLCVDVSISFVGGCIEGA